MGLDFPVYRVPSFERITFLWLSVFMKFNVTHIYKTTVDQASGKVFEKTNRQNRIYLSIIYPENKRISFLVLERFYKKQKQ